ncbi:FixH family protein [Gramella sp. AN32]|uniref:FixH family protein n=1 Tax=Christiangramia antarctica TaxID=2058158 RepID=A0ABW5X3N6_9FLAO|nr:FixH family protein [Gramella sp. AN32]MCM4157857.1 cytochrome C oxidase Cbb3 [Gramella sp. AN32]
MKINWGTGIVIGMAAFISFIMYFVVTMMTSKEYDHDLVVEDYYKAELHYQQDIDAEENALAMKENVSVLNQRGNWIVVLPESINLAEIVGNINLYRPSNKMLDFEIPLKDLTSHEIILPNEKMIDGRWNLSVNWKIRGKEYLFKKEILH